MTKEKIDKPIGVSLDAFDVEHFTEKVPNEADKHPTPEMLLIREAAKYLTKKQRLVWEYHNFERLTHDEIAKKLGKERSTITRTIQAAEKRITKWCKSNMGAYELLKSDFERVE